MARASIEDPVKVFRFRVVVDKFVRAGFTEVTGLSRETDVAEYREGGFNSTPQKSAGLTKYGDVTLKRGQIIGSAQGGDTDFLDWVNSVHQLATNGSSNDYRRNLDIEQYNSLNVLVRVWRLSNCFPKSLKPMSDLNGTSSDNSFEEIVIAHEGFEVVV